MPASNLTHSRIVYFYEAVKCGTIRAAADTLNVAPSAVSRQIRLLEDELGSPVIEHQNRGVKPTTVGLMLIDYYREQEANKDEFLSRLTDLSGLKQGHVNVVFGEGFLQELLSGPLYTFFTRYPNISLNLDVAGTNEVMRRIANEEADVGLVWNPSSEQKVVTRARGRQPLKVIASPSFPIAVVDGRVTIDEVFRHPIATSHQSFGIRQLLDDLATAEGIKFSPVVATNTSAVLKTFSKSGWGISFLPEFSVTEELRAGELVCYEVDHPVLNSAEAHLVCRTGRQLPMAANRMIQLVAARLSAFR